MPTFAFFASLMNRSSSPATTSTASALPAVAQPKKYESEASFVAICLKNIKDSYALPVRRTRISAKGQFYASVSEDSNGNPAASHSLTPSASLETRNPGFDRGFTASSDIRQNGPRQYATIGLPLGSSASRARNSARGSERA